MNLPWAEDMNYWKTSNSSAGAWLDKSVRFLEDSGATVVMSGRGRSLEGREAYIIEFHVAGDHFRVIWPVLPCSEGHEAAAHRQAATMLFHDVKSRAVRWKVMGARAAFFEALLLPDGRVALQVSEDEFISGLLPEALVKPRLLSSATQEEK